MKPPLPLMGSTMDSATKDRIMEERINVARRAAGLDHLPPSSFSHASTQQQQQQQQHVTFGTTTTAGSSSSTTSTIATALTSNKHQPLPSILNARSQQQQQQYATNKQQQQQPPPIIHRAPAPPTPQPTAAEASISGPDRVPLLGPKISSLLSSIDPSFTIDSEVEEQLLYLASDFVERLSTLACRLARHRGSKRMEVIDVQRVLVQQFGMHIPGAPLPSAPFQSSTSPPTAMNHGAATSSTTNPMMPSIPNTTGKPPPTGATTTATVAGVKRPAGGLPSPTSVPFVKKVAVETASGIITGMPSSSSSTSATTSTGFGR